MGLWMNNAKRAIKQKQITKRDADKLCDGCIFWNHGCRANYLQNIFPCEEPIKDGNQIVMNRNYIWVIDEEEEQAENELRQP